MTDKSVFTDSEWHALTDAPLLVTAAVFVVGEHGPISMMKEASASARSIAKPGERGVANELIGQIVGENDVDAPLGNHHLGDQVGQLRPRLRQAGKPLAEVPGPLAS